jgi:hypothetical protein
VSKKQPKTVAAAPAETATTEAAPATVKVRCPASPGLVAVGNYKPGQVYDVPSAEATRLVSAKGFEIVNQE